MISKNKQWLIHVVIGLLCYVSSTYSGYLITTPRRWTSGSESQVCVSFGNTVPVEGIASHKLTVTIESTGIEPEEILPPTDILFSQALGVQCEKVLLPTTKIDRAQISIIGSIGESTVNYTKPLSISTSVLKTFVQTDKYLYKPSQKVRFRILTVIGPKLKISTDQYDEIYLENPSGTRIAQWLNVPNENGLIHKEFQLSEEPEEGSYKINVLAPDKNFVRTIFKVEDYVLPRYKVTIKPPKYVLGTATTFQFKVCAKYTFGQPVKGTVTFSVNNGGWGNLRFNVTRQEKISGCKKFVVTSEELPINRDNFFSYQLQAKAIVIEEGTDVELNAKNVKVDISRTALQFEDISTQKFYKPESVYVGEVKVTFPDDSAALDEIMEVCISETCKNITTNKNGILKFAVPPHLQDETISVTAVNYPHLRANDSSWRSIMYGSSFRKNLKKYFSPSNSSLVIALQDDKVQCIPGENIKFSFPVSFSAVEIDKARVSIQVISRGQIMYASNDLTDFVSGSKLYVNPDILIEPVQEPVTRNLFRGSFEKVVELPGFASPKAKLIVFYSRPDGEVVADARTVDITECLMNAVNLTWSSEKAQPGEETTLSITAEPQSICSVGVVDKSVQLLSSKNSELTVSKLLDVADEASVKSYENLLVNDYEYCKTKAAEELDVPDIHEIPGGPPVFLPLPPRAIARKKRSFARSYFPYYSDDIDALHMFDDAGVYVFSDMQLESRPCRQRHGYTLYKNIAVAFNSEVAFSSIAMQGPGAFAPATKVRAYFPETWLWDLFLVWDTGVIEEVLTLPDTITEWVGSAVCVHPTKGVGISSPSSVITFRDFFADLTLPPSVKRGETFPVKISVFNYLKEPLPVTVVLEESSEYDILADEGVELGSGTRSSCVGKEDKTVYSIRIKPKAIGNINITVTASVDTNSLKTCGNKGTNKFRSDTLIKPVKVEIEGFEKDKAWTQYVCNGPESIDVMKAWTIAPPEDIIPDSARGFITAVGNLMGPTIENLGKLIKMPYGCGEQNMLNFAPNIFVMPYLERNETKNLAEKALEYMQKGYQRELNYRHKDGSYSAFGERDDSGSTWLTAFVLKSFAKARNFISIDNNDLGVSQNWLKRKQLENGCFESVGNVLHKGMKGGISKTSSPSLLSSFVLIALLEAGEDPTGKTVGESLYCLKADTDTNSSYALAVKAYALALAKSPDTDATLDELMNKADTSLSSIHWKLPKEMGSSVEVETAGYAVLALLTRDPVKHFPKATSVVQWMNNKRNGQGGFVSTQDTIVALQAISLFDNLTNKGPLNVDLFVDMTSNTGTLVEHFFHIDDTNDLLQQKVTMPFVPLSVSFLIEGEGCVLIQGVLRYNEPEPEASEAFSLTVTTSPEVDKSCKTKRVKACVSYLLPDFESNMGIIEVSLVSGYIPSKDDLKRVVGYGTGFFKRYEVDGNLVTFYVDKFTTEEICASFSMKQEVEVENPKPGLVKVYDYYKPEYYVTEKYTLPTECKTENELTLSFLQEIVTPLSESQTITFNPDLVEEPVTESLGDLLDAFEEAIL